MFRILRLGILAVACAVPFALPSLTEARPFPVAYRAGWFASPCNYGWHHYHWFRHGHYHR
jgi:hypothetical protein